MHPDKVDLANQITTKINQFCNDNRPGSTDSLSEVLGVTNEQTYNIINRIVLSIPDQVIYMADQSKKEKIVELIFSEFLLFQVNENINDPRFKSIFENFILQVNEQLSQLNQTSPQIPNRP